MVVARQPAREVDAGLTVTVTGSTQHQEAVRRLRASYAALAPGAPVRLAKRTSNLFRPRDAIAVAGLDVSGLDGVISVDPEARTADVQGMCTYEDLVDATLPHGLIPLVVPQLRTITLGGAVTGLGIESTSFRNGLPHESVLEMDVFTGAGEVVTCTARQRARRPVRDLPQLLRLARLRHPAAHRARAGRVPRRAAARPVHATPPRSRTRSPRSPRPASGTASASTPSTASSSSRGSTTSPSAAGRTSTGPGQRLRRPADLLALDPAARDRPAHRPTTTCGAGTPTGSGARGRSACRTRSYAGSGRAASSARTSTTSSSASTCASASPTGSTAGPAGPQRERVIQDIEVPVERLGEFLDWFDEAVGMRPVWLCPLRLRGETSLAVVPAGAGAHLRQRRLLGRGARRRRRPATARSTGRSRHKVPELDGHKSLYSESFYDRDDLRPALRRRQPRCGQAALRPRRPADHPLRQGGATTMTQTNDLTPQPARRQADHRARCSSRCSPARCRCASRRTTAARYGPEDAADRARAEERARPGLPGHRARRPRPGAAPTSPATSTSTASTRATPTRA